MTTMKIFILILLLGNGSDLSALKVASYGTEKACQEAGAATVEQAQAGEMMGPKIKALCVPAPFGNIISKE